MNLSSPVPLRYRLLLLAAALQFSPATFAAPDQVSGREPTKHPSGEIIDKTKPQVVFVPAGPKKQRISEKCDSDRRKFCGSISPGFARVETCLRENREELSPACGARIARMQSDRETNGRVGVVNANEE